jgi:3-oxoacyl-[acyl-carrier protein] reductase
MDLHLAGKRALVTASTGGIGREIAVSLAREGAHVAINGRTRRSVDAAVEYVHSHVPAASVQSVVADNGTAEGVMTTVAAMPAVDVLVNNLGVYEAVGFFEESDRAWEAMFSINVMSAVRLSRHYLNSMLAAGSGRVLIMASEAALMPSPEMAHYSATKTMLLSLSRSLAELTKGTEVTVNAIVAGSTRTDGVADFLGSLYPGVPFDEAEKQFMGPGSNRSTSLIQRLIRPQEIADLITYVSSPRAAAINGAALRVDGGLVRSVI